MSTNQPAEVLAAKSAARARLAPYLVLAIGVLIVASASIMIRGAQQLGMPSATIAALRLGFAALALPTPRIEPALPMLRIRCV